MTATFELTPAPALDVLLVDDEASIRLSLSDELRQAGHQVEVAADGREALAALARRPFDIVLCDVRMPALDGIQVLQRVRRDAPTTSVIMMTAFGAVPDAVAALQSGAADYLTKPFEIAELLMRMERLSQQRSLRRAFDQLGHEAATGMLGRSGPMLRLFDQVRKLGASDAPVLISGESGTGKELVAAALHRHSPRNSHPFVAINCAAIPESLLEAELFGHERGAFTGADRRREGRFKMADRGTLLLDEVAEMPLPAQAKLLRVLQDKSFEPLGTNQTLRVDVRVLSATHRNLKSLVATGVFRHDLYYRLKILELDVPPLRQRPGDLTLLIAAFMKKCARPGGSEPSISARALAALNAHPFPGNVRELEHAVHHAMALAGPNVEVDLMHLPSDITEAGSTEGTEEPAVQPLHDALGDFEREYLQRALSVHRRSRTATAAALGISRKNLWEKLRKHGLEVPERPTD